jgi:hypothetical protein
MSLSTTNPERYRLDEQRRGIANWRLWGPYLAERAWGTVREDYSPDGAAWGHFTQDQARARAYRWSEDGLDAFHRRVVEGDAGAVNPALRGTKFAAWSTIELGPGQDAWVDLVLSATPLDRPFTGFEKTLALRQSEATIFYDDLLPEATPNDARILRQALSGLIWSQQFYHYDVARWLAGDQVRPPAARLCGRNAHWRHLKACDILSMPDTWEYPWFAAWDLAYQCAALALVDVDLAKSQVKLLVSWRYLHPNGQLPGYE